MGLQSWSKGLTSNISRVEFTYLMCFIAICTLDLSRDYILSNYLITTERFANFLRLLTDSTIHSVIGLMIWLTVDRMVPEIETDVGLTIREEALVSYLMSTGIDVDHFIAAKSWFLIDAANLQTRSGLFAHNIIFPIFMFIFFKFACGRSRLAALLFGSIFSHLLRDATRTGILCFPFGVSPPVPYFMYFCIIAFLPRLLVAFMRREASLLKSRFIDEDSRGKFDNV